MNEELLKCLRDEAKKGGEVSLLIELIRKHVDSTEFNVFLVMNYFMKAYNLSFSQIKELPGAFCLGGGVYANEEINELIYPRRFNFQVQHF